MELKKYKPDIIINCAGESNVNVCNKNKNNVKIKFLLLQKIHPILQRKKVVIT